jgi:hypothetical protein
MLSCDCFLALVIGTIRPAKAEVIRARRSMSGPRGFPISDPSWARLMGRFLASGRMAHNVPSADLHERRLSGTETRSIHRLSIE